MTTARELIASSLRLITVLGSGETIPADDAADSLKTLNQMLDSWAADGQVIYERAVETFPLSQGVNSYTMGPGGDFDTTRPLSITQVNVSLGVINYPLDIWGWETYSTLDFTNFDAICSDVYVNNTNPLVELKFYPNPIGSLTTTIYSMKNITDLTLDTVLAYPPGYERALRFNLAVELAPEYEREASKTIRDIAFQSLATIKRNNQQYAAPMSRVDPILDQRYSNQGSWGWSIWGGN